MLWEGSRSGSDPSFPISLWSRGFESLHLRLLCSCWDPQGPSILWVVHQGLHLFWKGHLALRNFIWDPGRLRTSFLIFPRACVPGKHHWLQAFQEGRLQRPNMNNMSIRAPSSSASRAKLEKKLWKGLEKMIEFFMFCFVLLFYLVLVTTFLLNSPEGFFSSWEIVTNSVETAQHYVRVMLVMMDLLWLPCGCTEESWGSSFGAYC